MNGDDFLRRLRIDGQRVDARVDGRLVSAVVNRTMAGASSIDLGLDDHDLALIESGLLSKPGKPTKKQEQIDDFDQAAWARFGSSRLTLDGWFTRLAGVAMEYSPSGGLLTPTFEDEIATPLRRRTNPKVSSRRGGPNGAGQTRAQFFAMLLGISRQSVGFERFFCPEISVDQAVKQPDDPDRKKGIAKHANISLHGAAPTDEQRNTIERVLTVADEQNAPTGAALALIEACIVEAPDFANPTGGDGSSVGILQLIDSHLGGSTSTRGGRRDIELVCKLFLTVGFSGKGGAISLARKNPSWSPGQIAQAVQGSAYPARYEQQRDEADAILDAWGGVSTTEVIEHKGQFKVGGHHRGGASNWWDDMGNLAQEVRWRLFADLNILYFVSDNWLFQRRPVIRIDRGLLTGGLFEIHATADVGTPVAEIEVVAKVDDWKSPPGATVEIGDMGPLNGRWLLWESSDDKLRDQVTLTLHRPQPKLKEPAGRTSSRTVTPAGDDVTQSGLIYPLSERGTDLGGVAAHKARAWGNWQSDNAVDIGVARGTKVYAVADGTIVKLGGSWDGTGLSNPNGFNVTLSTGRSTQRGAQGLPAASGINGNEWFYTHMMKREPLKIGQKVKAGELIGRSGAANGVNHLHIACLHGDPEKLLDVKS